MEDPSLLLISFDLETEDQISYIINLGQVQKALLEYGNKIIPVPDSKSPTVYIPRRPNFI